MNGEEKLKAFRKEMEARGYDAYVIPHGDQHDVRRYLTNRTNTLPKLTRELNSSQALREVME